MPFTLRPYRRFPVRCSATYNVGLFQAKIPFIPPLIKVLKSC